MFKLLIWFCKPFKKLPKGIYRIFITLFILCLPCLIIIDINYEELRTGFDNLVEILFYFILFAIFYWGLIRIGIWIWEGFKEEDKKRKEEI